MSGKIRDPLFRGATRTVMLFGVPLVPFMLTLISCIVIVMVTHVYWFLLLYVPLYLWMRVVSSKDDQAFHVMALTLAHKFCTLKSRRIWGGFPNYGDDDYYHEVKVNQKYLKYAKEKGRKN
jgi:type IV secretory pathway VirB3-like protein